MEGEDTTYTGVKTVFSWDYTEPEAPSSAWELVELEQVLLPKPRLYCIDYRAAQQLYMTLLACDELAKELSGRIRVTVDYDRRTADIGLECRLLEFNGRWLSELLHEITVKAYHVRIESLPDGFVRLYILMPYFM